MSKKHNFSKNLCLHAYSLLNVVCEAEYWIIFSVITTQHTHAALFLKKRVGCSSAKVVKALNLPRQKLLKKRVIIEWSWMILSVVSTGFQCYSVDSSCWSDFILFHCSRPLFEYIQAFFCPGRSTALWWLSCHQF